MYTCCFNLTSPGKPSELNDRCHPDWVPSLNMGYNSTSTAQIASCHSRFIQQRGRVKVSSIHEYRVVHMHSLCFLVNSDQSDASIE